VRHYRGAEFLTTTRYATLRDALDVFENDSLVASPGSRYAYSSYGYNLIGAVLESACGSSYPALLHRAVLAPLGMRSTGPDLGGETLGRAQLYSVDSLGVRSAVPDDLSGRWPSGGLLSSTDDMARLGRSMLAAGFLTSESLQLMVTPQRLADNTSTAVGIGWRIRADSSGSYWHHGGSSNGGSAFLLVYPNEKLIVSMASNAFAAWGERDAVEIARLFLHSGHQGKAVHRHAGLKPKGKSAANSRRERRT
jgi:CubicO group peptidase (beta-lactamase class C family)